MNDDELREALRPPQAIDPLDPAKVIAGAHRRRRRGMAAGSAAAVAVLAVVAASVLAGTRPTGSPVVEQPPAPSVSTSAPGTPSPPATPPQGMGEAELARRCQLELGAAEHAPGAKATRQAILSSADGTVLIVADSKYWGACDTGYQPVGVAQLSVRQPGKVARPSATNTDAFAVAGNTVTVAGKEIDYYWAAGLLPSGVKTVRYTFPDGGSEDAPVTGKYWLMHHWAPVDTGSQSTPGPGRVRVRLLAPDGSVVNDFELTPGEQTCEQISHGC